MPITALPTPVPTRSDPANFSVRADAFLSALPVFATEANALQTDVNAKQVAAAASAAAAAATTGVTAWVSGTTYALGNVRYDTTDFQTYRRIVAGAGTTRPGLDPTNWQAISGDTTTTGTQTLTNKTISTGSSYAGAAIPIANGGTGQTTALAAFNAIKQAATDTFAGTVELAISSEVRTGSDTTRAVTPSAVFLTAFAYGQTWQDVTGSRAFSTAYTNTTGRPILVAIEGIPGSASSVIEMAVGATTAVRNVGNHLYVSRINLMAVVPAGATYSVGVSGSTTLVRWTELR